MKTATLRSVPIDPRSRQNEAASEPESRIIQLIIFRLGEEEYAANINQVREIIRTGTITPIPDSPDFIKGVCSIRGEIPVIIDLKERLVLPTHSAVENRHIVMTEQDKNVFGLLVDAVTEVLRIPETEIKAAPALVTQIDREYVDGVITRENRLIVLLDLEKVLSTKELARLTEFYQGDRWAKRTEKAKARPSEVQTEAAETEHKVPEPLPV